MEEKIKELLKKIGRPYQMFNEDGTYQGCFYPVQFLYPKLKKFKMRTQDKEKSYVYAMKKLNKYCKPVSIDEIKTGDIIATKFKDVLHVGIYLDYGKVIHIFQNNTLQIGRLKMFKNFQAFKVSQWD